MSEVIAFRDTVLPGQPFDELVLTIEGLLERAKRGELRALAYATVAVNGVIGTGWDGADGTNHSLAAAISILSTRYPIAMAEPRT